MAKNIYKNKPFKIIKDIPVFSKNNEYIENYNKISADMIASYKKKGVNPFMDENLLTEAENSTRDFILKHIKSGKILDVGVGLGGLISGLPPSFDKFGMDISLNYLKITKEKGIDVCLAMIEDIPYKEEVFDIVTCTDVLEHVLDLNLACKNILSVLKKGGLLFVRVPYREDLRSYLDPKANPYKFVHLRNFDEFSLRLLFEKIFDCKIISLEMTGLIISENDYKFFLPQFLKAMLDRKLVFLKKHWPKYYRKIAPIFYKSRYNEIISLVKK